ncbi:GNAT family N-acetyltransferase [Dyadobacter sandarakinus]|uniref:GNAT family N-acetyltransferase n=1 Tax=Dyadobacter sandarakinus TaxID=2747268 RepID=A0ABX7IBE4_9BACT|nr:GNAT family N-acetyltransferase [Dyadobacter sandarakinus]QRR03439.1 GNAT family N-acetyltransferase [Dyadobacter sandarakinus]
MAVTPIITDRLALHKITSDDGDKYYRLSNNAKVMKFVTGYALSRKESDEMLRSFLIEYGPDSHLGRYLIEDRQSGELIGMAKLDWSGFDIEIGYRVMEEHWGKGIATEVASALIRFALTQLKARTVAAYVNVDNTASVRVLEKAGMKRVGVIEDIDEVKYKYIYSPHSHQNMKKAIYVVTGIIAVFLIIAVIMPKSYAVERDIVIHRPKGKVFEYLRSLKNQDQWSVWMQRDPNIVKEYIGIDGEPGFVTTWRGNKEVGKGEQEIKHVEEGKRIDTELRFIEPFKSTSNAYMITEATDSASTRVRWGFTGAMPIPMNVMLPFIDLDKMVGKDFEAGLKNLKTILEK